MTALQHTGCGGVDVLNKPYLFLAQMALPSVLLIRLCAVGLLCFFKADLHLFCMLAAV
jgi:hypothetical protein